MKTLKLLTTLLILLAASVMPTQAQNRNITWNYSMGLGPDIGEACVSGDYAYVAAGTAGIRVVKIFGPGAPALVGTIRPYVGLANVCISDVQVVGTTLYAGNQVPNGAPAPVTGLFMYDLTMNPVAPTLVGTLTWGAGPLYHLGASAYGFTVDVVAGRSYAYIASAICNSVPVYDVTIPAFPVIKATLRNSTGNTVGVIHDVAVKNGKCVSCYAAGGFAIHNVSNIAASQVYPILMNAPPLINITRYASALTYHAAFSADGNTLITTDGRYYIGCRTWNLNNIVPNTPLLHTAQLSGTAFMHKVHVNGKYLYLANALDGLRVVELLPSGLMTEVGRYDTAPTYAGISQAGAMDVVVAGEQVLISDTISGLMAVDFKDTISVLLADWNQSTNELTIESTSSAAPSVGLSVGGYGSMTWNPNANKYVLTVSGVLANPGTIMVTSDIGGSQAVNVQVH